MEEFAIDLDKVLDEFEETEGIVFFQVLSCSLGCLFVMCFESCSELLLMLLITLTVCTKIAFSPVVFLSSYDLLMIV